MALVTGCQPPAQKADPKKAEAAKATPDAKPGEGKKPPATIATGEPSPQTALEVASTEAKPKPAEPASGGVAGGKAAGDPIVLGSDELFVGIPGDGPLKLAEIQTWLDDPKNHEEFKFELPLGLAAGASQITGVDHNPLTRAKIELGRQLYFDPRLSVDESISCASCHDPEKGFGGGTQFGVGIQGQTGNRNSPVSYNRILSGAQFWDGRAPSLEAQAIGPIANPIEMGHTHEACVECLMAIPGYKLQFEKIFGKKDIAAVGEALASFERAIVTGPSAYDYAERLRTFSDYDLDELKDEDPALYAKYQELAAAAKEAPMSESAEHGRELFFGKANCTACHVGANFTDEKYHNLGVGMDAPEDKIDRGRAEVSKLESDTGAFKTPTIRNIEFAGPFMHDGSQQTLEEVVEWYAKGGHPNPYLDAKIKKLDLTDQDKKDLVAFMKSTTGKFPKIERARLPE